MKKYHKIIRRVVIMFLVLFLLIFPYVIDRLQLIGVLHRIPHSFSGNDWFTFMGSYFPAMLFGVITYRQSLIIEEKQNKINELKDKYAFKISTDCTLWRYSASKGKIGNYSYADAKREVREMYDIRADEYKKYYALNFAIDDTLNYGINDLHIKNICWKIHNQEYVQNNMDVFCTKHYLQGIYHIIVVFWKFDDNLKSVDDIMKHMSNFYRHAPGYDSSHLLVEMEIMDNEQEVMEINANFEMECQENDEHLKSVDGRVVSKHDRKNRKNKRKFAK